jgi:hypothetical protein
MSIRFAAFLGCWSMNDRKINFLRAFDGTDHQASGCVYGCLISDNLPFKIDHIVKGRKTSFFVIPAKAGIQCFKLVTKSLDSGFHWYDDFYETIKIKLLVLHANLCKEVGMGSSCR